MDTQTDKMCSGLGIPAAMREQLFDSLSGGEKTRVNLARLLLEQTDILLLDEPTNHLDMKNVEWLEEYLLSFKGTVLTISHDRYFLDRVVQRIIEIRGGKAEFYSGNYSFYVVEKQARYDLQLKQYEQEQAKLKQLGYTVERMKGWGINNRTLYRRAMSIQHRMERIEKTERPTKDRTVSARFGERDFRGDSMLSIRGMKKAFDDRVLFEDVELKMLGGESIAFLGDNGTGKSTFIKCLLGEEPCEGKIKFGPQCKWAYLPQIIHFSHPERSLYDTMLYETNCTPQQARDRLGAFLFSGEDVFKPVSVLSGGELMRLRLCLLMDEKVNLLVLDEPTNHMDIASREWIEQALEDYEGNLIFVSHDRYFVEKFATRIWELKDGHVIDHPYGYEKYRAVQEKERQARLATPSEPKKKAAAKPAAPKQKSTKRQLELVEKQIEKLETSAAKLDEQIAEAAMDYQKLQELMEEKQAVDDQLSTLYEQWEELSLEMEEGQS